MKHNSRNQRYYLLGFNSVQFYVTIAGHTVRYAIIIILLYILQSSLLFAVLFFFSYLRLTRWLFDVLISFRIHLFRTKLTFNFMYDMNSISIIRLFVSVSQTHIVIVVLKRYCTWYQWTGLELHTSGHSMCAYWAPHIVIICHLCWKTRSEQ